jgi:hypothetical protein|tara:strand:- start:781 stop:1038 length:258 start_codon:yes stop_codon:yes gene_type:complete
MIKKGDLVMLADDRWKVPGALSAIKYFHRIQKNYSGKPMLVIEVFEKEQTSGVTLAGNQTIVVFVDGHKHAFSSTLLKVISEEKD